MASVTGDKNHAKRLAALSSPQAQQLITQALYVGGQLLELDAERSITAGSISGKGHVPSAPGSPPNADTRRLDSNIDTTVVGQGVVEVTSRAPYSAALEYGTSRMAERPFMRPAAARNRGKVTQLVRQAVDKLTRGS
jgi:HK97 gp10 family phage protein